MSVTAAKEARTTDISDRSSVQVLHNNILSDLLKFANLDFSVMKTIGINESEKPLEIIRASRRMAHIVHK
jgi:hypothetical protein